MQNDTLFIQLDDIDVQDVEILAQEGSRGMTEFAASCCDNCNCPELQNGSCTQTTETRIDG